MRTRLRRSRFDAATTLSDDDDDSDESSLAPRIESFMSATTRRRRRTEADGSFIDVRADDETLGAAAAASSAESTLAPPSLASPPPSPPPPPSSSSRRPATAAPTTVRSATLPTFETYHVVDPEQYRRFRAGDIRDDVLPPADAAPSEVHAQWAKRQVDFRRRLDDQPWYRQATLVAAYAGVPLEDIVYIPSVHERRRRTRFGGGTTGGTFGTQRGRDLFLNRLFEGQLPREVGGGGGGERPSPQAELRARGLRANIEHTKRKQARNKHDQDTWTREIAELTQTNDVLRGLEDTDTNRKQLEANAAAIATLQTKLVAARDEATTLADTLRDYETRLRNDDNVDADIALPPESEARLRPQQQTVVSGYSEQYNEGMRRLKEDMQAVVGSDEPASLDRLRRLEQRREQLAILRRIEDQTTATVRDGVDLPLKRPETTGLVFVNPTFPAHQQMALTMVRQRFPQTLAATTIQSFESSETCATLFAQITAALFSRGVFVSGRRPQRASDYSRYEDGVEFAMRQLRFARLDARRRTVEMNYGAVAEFRNAAAARSPQCSTTLTYASTPYYGGAGVVASSPQTRELDSMRRLRDLVGSSPGFMPLVGRAASTSPYGDRRNTLRGRDDVATTIPFGGRRL